MTNYRKLLTIVSLGLFCLSLHPFKVALSAELKPVEEGRNSRLFDRELLQGLEIENEAAEESSEEEPPPEDVMLEETENPFLSLIQALENLKQLENYQVTYSMTNLENGEKIAGASIVGNQLTGDMMGALDFYFPKAHPDHYEIDFISFRNFDLAYIQRFKFIESMAFFQQPYFSADFSDRLSQYFEAYVAIDNEELNRVDLRLPQLDSLLMLPDMRRLLEVDSKHLHELNGLYIVSLERLQIPEFLFSRSDNFSFDYELGFDIQLEETDAFLSSTVDVNSTQRFEVSENSNSLNFGINVDSEIADELMENLDEEVAVITPDFSRTLKLDSDVMLEKLTKVTLIYNEKTQSYRIRLIGIVENIEFNFFTSDAAGLETTEFMLEYELRPTNIEVPALSQIETLTSREADYILEEIILDAAHP